MADSAVTVTLPRLQRSNTFPIRRISPPLPLVDVSPANVVREKLRADVDKRRSLTGFNDRSVQLS
jgi:hypothetical protein